MAVTNLYSNLPGHLVEFKDGGLQLTSNTTQTSSTKSLLILGTATDGPINEPVKIDANTVSQVFGKEVNEAGYPNGATLTKYAKQAFKNGFDDVRCMRVTGSQAFTTLLGEKTTDYNIVTKTVEETDTTVVNNGKIRGNIAFEWKANTENDPYFLAQVASSSDYLAIVHADGTEEQISFNDLGKVSYTSFEGFNVEADAFPMINNLKLHCKGIDFIGTVPVSGNPGLSYETVDHEIAASEVTDDGGDPATVTKIEFSIPVPTDDGEEVQIFTTKLVNEPKLPVITAANASGFTLKKGADALVEGTDFSVAKVDGNYVFTFNNPTSIAEGDTISIQYYPFKEIIVDKTFSTEIDYESSTLSVAVVDTLLDPTLKRVLIGTSTAFTPEDEGFGDRFEVSDGVLTVKDTAGFNIGDTIKAVYEYKEPIKSNLEIKVKSQWGGSLYKTGTVKVDKASDSDGDYTLITFKRPVAKRLSLANPPYVYSSRNFPTIDDLILAMKNDPNNLNMFEIEIVAGDGTYPIDMLQATAELPLSEGGEDGLKPSNNAMFKALSGERYTESDVGSPISKYSSELVTMDMIGYLKTQGAYQILENYNVDYIYPAGVYADSEQTVNIYSDFQRELALLCAVLTYRTKMTHGFIDVKPNSNTTLVGIDAYVAKLVNGHPNLYYMTDQDGNVLYDSDNKPMDIGWYTSVVVGPEVVMSSDVLGTYYGSPAIAYAALNSVLEPQSSPLNKALRNVDGMKFKFSNKQMDALVGNRMVVFKLKNEGTATASSTPYVVDGVTAGAPNCDYSDIATVKVVTDVVDNIREVADPFIGEPNTVEQRNALSALISKRLAKLKEIGEIQSYEFEISATIQQQLLGEASIALTIVPALTLRKITTVVALRAAE
jgi:hypothetical protein